MIISMCNLHIIFFIYFFPLIILANRVACSLFQLPFHSCYITVSFPHLSIMKASLVSPSLPRLGCRSRLSNSLRRPASISQRAAAPGGLSQIRSSHTKGTNSFTPAARARDWGRGYVEWGGGEGYWWAAGGGRGRGIGNGSGVMQKPFITR